MFEAAGGPGRPGDQLASRPARPSDEHVLWARRHGVRFAVDTDAHAVPHLDHRRFGVGVAQRGWLTKDDVINAWPLGKLKKFLAQREAVTTRQAAAVVLRATLDRARARPARPRPGPPAADGSRASAGSWRWRRTSPTTRRGHAFRGDAAERDDVRAGRLPVRVLHVRHALLHERGGAWPGEGSAVLSARANRSRVSHGCVQAAVASRSGSCAPDRRGSRRRSTCRVTSTARISSTATRSGSIGEAAPPSSAPARASVSTRSTRLALLDRGEPVRVPRPAGSAYAEGDGEGSSGSVHDTVIVTVLVWNASVPAAGLCMITVPFGCVDGAVVTST